MRVLQDGYKLRSGIALVVLIACALGSLVTIPGVFGIVGYTVGAPVFMFQIASVCTLAGVVTMTAGGGLLALGILVALSWMIGNVVKSECRNHRHGIKHKNAIDEQQRILDNLPQDHYQICKTPEGWFRVYIKVFNKGDKINQEQVLMPVETQEEAIQSIKSFKDRYPENDLKEYLPQDA